MNKIKFKHSILALVGFSLIANCCFAQKNKKTLSVKSYVFNYQDFEFPEEKYLTDKENFGIVISGGGSRSASLAAGELRALNMIGLLEKAKYLSAVSGGAWASIMFSYYQPHNDELFLGIYIYPEKLTLDDLNSFEDQSLIHSLSNGMSTKKVFKKLLRFRGDDTYAGILNDGFLKPLGNKISNSNLFFTYKKENALEISQRASHYDNRITNDGSDFISMNTQNNRPYLIVNGTVVQKNFWHSPELMLHMEMTPLYSGITYYNGTTSYPVGGGYLESFGIDRKFNNDKYLPLISVKSYKRNKKEYKHRFGLSDMMAITGFAPGEWVNSGIRQVITGNVGGPEMNFFPIKQVYDTQHSKIKSPEFILGDGGNLENLGIIPLLKRRVPKIIVFVNSKKSIEKNGQIDASIGKLFGILHGDDNIANVLQNKNDEYQHLVDTLIKLKFQGKPLIYKDTYKVNYQHLYSVVPNCEYTEVEIMWVYNDNFDRLYLNSGRIKNQEVLNTIKNPNEIPEEFPHLKTFRGKLGLSHELKALNLASHWSSWVIMDNKQQFLDFIND